MWKIKSPNIIKLKKDGKVANQFCPWDSFTNRKEFAYKPRYSIYTKLIIIFFHLTASCQLFYQKTNKQNRTNKQKQTKQSTKQKTENLTSEQKWER